MPGCVLRVSGSTSKVREFLAKSTLDPLKVYWRGEPGFPKSRGPSKTSGFNIALSSSVGESIEKQAKQATRFLTAHATDMLFIKTLGFKHVVIDFGLYDLSTEDHPWPSYRLPATFVQLVGGYGFEVNLSFYGAP
jgi:hypothetical protein